MNSITLTTRRLWTHNTENWCLIVVNEGNGTLEVPGDSYDLKTGDVAVLPGGLVVRLKAVSPRTSITTVPFQPECLTETLSLGSRLAVKQGFNRRNGVRVVSNASGLSRRLQAMSRFLSESGDLKEDYMALIGPLLNELSEVLGRETKSSAGTHNRILTTLDSIETADLVTLSVSELAKRCGCCRRHLARLLRENCGVSLTAVKIELRLDRAAKMLRESETKVIDVAYECGFNHLGSFTARFRRKFGATPAEWRKQVLLAAA